MNHSAFQWEWHNQCGSGLTEQAVAVSSGIFIAFGLLVWLVVWLIERR